MRAILHERYGPPEVLKIGEVAAPERPPGGTLVAVRAFSVNSGDARIRAARFPPIFALPGRLMFGLTRPKHRVPGSNFAGIVTAGGADLPEGARVFGFLPHGAAAEVVAVPAGGAVAAIPEGLTFEEAAALPFGGVTALVFLRDLAKLRAGERLAVVGASGAVGVAAVQIGRDMGATVTAVTSAANADLVRGLGAETVIDYRAEDFAGGGRGYDVIFDAVGGSTLAQGRAALGAGGRHVFTEFGAAEIAAMATGRLRGGPKVICGVAGDTRSDVQAVAALAARGALRPVIDSSYPFEDIAEAHRRVDSGRKRGAVVVRLGDGAPI